MNELVGANYIFVWNESCNFMSFSCTVNMEWNLYTYVGFYFLGNSERTKYHNIIHMLFIMTIYKLYPRISSQIPK